MFSSITLLGVEDIDFFGVERNTKLPLIGITVPVITFFAAGAALVSAFYIYFHIYLIQLWEALGAARYACERTVRPAVGRYRPWSQCYKYTARVE